MPHTGGWAILTFRLIEDKARSVRICSAMDHVPEIERYMRIVNKG